MRVPTFLRRSAVLSAVTAAVLCGSAASALASSGLQCANSSQYGSSCIDITGSALRVEDVQGYFTPPNNDYLSHRRWALELTSYRCDPIHRTKSQCPVRQRWFTRVRRGNPPHQGSTCATLGGNGLSFQQCQDYGVAYADANFGDWRGFYRMPRTFGATTWLCTELAVRVHHHWRTNGAAGSTGVRGCAEIHD